VVDAEEQRRREADLRTVFSRPWTELYLASPRQNACGESHFVGHRGAPVGSVSAVRGSRREGTFLRFTSARALEVHDGLQVEIPGLVKPYGFSIEKLRSPDSPGWNFQAGPGVVEVSLPPEHPTIPVDAAVYCASSQAVKKSFRWIAPKAGEFRRRLPLDVSAHVTPHRVELAARLDLHGRRTAVLETVQSLDDAFGPARDPDAAAQGARAAFERLGNTPFVLGKLRVENEQSLFVSPSQWNRLRRTTAEALAEAFAEALEEEIGAVAAAVSADASLPDGTPSRREVEWSLKIERLAQLEAFAPEDWERAAEVVVALGVEEGDLLPKLSALGDRVGRGRVRLALPPVLRPWDEARLLPQAAQLMAEGWKRWEVANLAHWGHLGLALGEDPHGVGLDLTADWPLYVVNSSAGRALLDLGLSGFALSPEDGSENLKKLVRIFGPCATVIVYQNTPLFTSETCPQANLAGACPGPERCDFRSLDLVSDFGNRVRVLNRRCRTVVVSRSSFCLSTALIDLASAGASNFRVDLQYSDLSPGEARDLWRSVRAGKAVAGSHAGNYQRGLL
jgi:putative protease